MSLLIGVRFVLSRSFFFCKQKTAYEMRISDWSSDVCSSDLWSSMGTAAPNTTHRLLAGLEAQGRLSGLITQNVDGLHTAAGHRDLVEQIGRASCRERVCHYV